MKKKKKEKDKSSVLSSTLSSNNLEAASKLTSAVSSIFPDNKHLKKIQGAAEVVKQISKIVDNHKGSNPKQNGDKHKSWNIITEKSSAEMNIILYIYI